MPHCILNFSDELFEKNPMIIFWFFPSKTNERFYPIKKISNATFNSNQFFLSKSRKQQTLFSGIFENHLKLTGESFECDLTRGNVQIRDSNGHHRLYCEGDNNEKKIVSSLSDLYINGYNSETTNKINIHLWNEKSLNVHLKNVNILVQGNPFYFSGAGNLHVYFLEVTG